MPTGAFLGFLNTTRSSRTPPELSGFRKERCTAHAISDLATDLEVAKPKGDTAYVVFLDVCRAYDSLPHDTILHQLQSLGVVGRLYIFIAAFLADSSFVVRSCGIPSNSRKAAPGVPQRSVLSPLLLNIAIAALPSSVSNSAGLPLQMAVYADDVAPWSIGTSARAQAIRARLQNSLSAVSSRLNELGLTVSTPLLGPRY